MIALTTVLFAAGWFADEIVRRVAKALTRVANTNNKEIHHA